jgi:cell division transport system permease protein
MALKLDYVGRETVTNLRRNLILTTASMLTVAVSLAMVGVAFLLHSGVSNATARWKNDIEFEVFLNLEATPAQKERIQRQLDTNPDVQRTRFVGREEQYELFRDLFADNPAYLENVRVDDLPESIRVAPRIDDADVIGAIADQVANEPGVKEVAFAHDQVKQAVDTARGMQLAALIVASVLFIASSVHIFNTIRTAIFARRREIEVMKLVGATNWFIRVPFMVEGLVQGVVGAGGAFVVVYWLKTPLSRWIQEHFVQLAGFHVNPGDGLVAGIVLLLVGSVIGAASAGVAVTRFLDV